MRVLCILVSVGLLMIWYLRAATEPDVPRCWPPVDERFSGWCRTKEGLAMHVTSWHHPLLVAIRESGMNLYDDLIDHAWNESAVTR